MMMLLMMMMEMKYIFSSYSAVPAPFSLHQGLSM
jgi:hypothetical protein